MCKEEYCEGSNSSEKRKTRSLEEKKKKRQEYEENQYKQYLARKTYNPRKFAKTMSEPLNVDSDGEEIESLDVDGNHVISDSPVLCSDVGDIKLEVQRRKMRMKISRVLTPLLMRMMEPLLTTCSMNWTMKVRRNLMQIQISHPYSTINSSRTRMF